MSHVRLVRHQHLVLLRLLKMAVGQVAQAAGMEEAARAGQGGQAGGGGEGAAGSVLAGTGVSSNLLIALLGLSAVTFGLWQAKKSLG